MRLSSGSTRRAIGLTRLVLPSPNGSSTACALAASARVCVGASLRNGVAVAVSQPAPFVPSASAAGYEAGGQAVIFTIAVVNGSQENYDPTLFTTSLQSGNREASQIFDSAKNLGGTPSTVVLPGREAEFQVAYAVSDPTDLVVEVSPRFEYRDAIFTF
ncbi:hypothetical protein [Rhodococcus sp. OK519]|uniref:hypothetical protein n=1 Tax=Rhodococcus sp. OK519 TaxID=2135729 RepID=UPI0011B25364